MTAMRTACRFSIMLTMFLLFGPAHAKTVVGSGVVKTESRDVAGFHEIVLGVPARLEIRQGAREALTITADDNVLPLIRTVVENGALKIRWADEGTSATRPREITVVVDAKTVDGMALGGAGQIYAKQLKTGTLNARIGGSGEIVLEALDAEAARVTLGGSGRLSAAGRAGTLEATLAGSGDLLAAKLETEHARTTLQGSARATVWAKETLKVTIAGSGEVVYYGKPTVSQTIAGSGSVIRAGNAP
jgi:hypothetical protein